MTVEEIRRDDDNFPAGLRVLAVDDDPICLKLLETLLRKCQYHVSTTNQAQAALKMLRENKNKFDLVISDVQMPNMDGFKLLELVGLEMDLPVIMLSANGDPKLVLKGVTHGACDYLVKPVRIEELRNIWQHVIRRKKIDVKSRNECKDRVEGDRIGRPNRKRKEEEDDSEENNGNESEDSGTQKRPRVVWSIELHRKFVAAVNQLGIEKAVPKRILDLMNVENLSRENVASHLQKYRLYLKRISSVHQANMIPSLGVKDTAFMHTGSFNEVDNFQSLSRSRLPNASLSSSFASNAMFGRLNNPTSMNLHNLAPIQHARSQNLANPIGKVRLLLPSANQNGGSLFQGMMPSPLEVDHLPLNKGPSLDFGINMDGSRIFSGVGTFSDLGVAIGGPRNLPSHNSSCKDNNAPQALAFGEFENQPSHEMGLFDTESFNPGLHQNHDNHLLPLPLTPPDETFGGPRNSDCSFFSSDPIELSSDMALVTSEPRRDYANRPSTLNSIVSQLGQTQNSGILGQKLNMLVNGGSGFFQNDGSGDFLVGQPTLQGGFVQQSYDSSLDELMNAMIKRAP